MCTAAAAAAVSNLARALAAAAATPAPPSAADDAGGRGADADRHAAHRAGYGRGLRSGELTFLGVGWEAHRAALAGLSRETWLSSTRNSEQVSFREHLGEHLGISASDIRLTVMASSVNVIAIIDTIAGQA